MQEPKFNINEITANFLTIKSDEIVELAKSSFKKFSNTLNVKLKKKYTNYLKAITTKYGNTRTFFIRDNPKPLYDFYVAVGLKCEDQIIHSANIKQLIDINQKIIIRGIGGSGKTVVLKHLLLDTLTSNHKVPVFLELRDINEKSSGIDKLIFNCLKTFGLNIDMDYLNKSLLNGHYIILLDGLDEIAPDIRVPLIKEIEDFSKKYSKCDFIITSRPEEKLSEFKSFTTFETLPLDLKKSVSLISKLPAEKEIKVKFIKDLENGLFEKHQTFLSNPLLLSIMLLTYGYSADIPNRLSIFYNQAYEALFQRHDALKGAYNRTRETELDIISFEKVLSAFSLYTYDNNSITFSRIEALEYLEKTKSLVGFDFNTEDFLKDFLQAVCLLVEDGLFLTYSHRSFQEYFVAKFITSSSVDIKKKLLTKYIDRLRTDEVYKLTFELDQDFMEKEIMIPFLTQFFESIKVTKSIGKTHLLKYLQTRAKKISLNETGVNSLVGLRYISEQCIYEFDMFTFIVNEILGGYKIDFSSTHNLTPKKYLGPEGFKEYSTSSLKTNDEVFCFVYNYEGWLSKIWLQKQKDCLDYLNKKHNKKNKDLENLLKG